MTQQSNSTPQTQQSSASSYSGESNEGKTIGQFLKNFKTEIENKNEKMKRGLKKFKEEWRNADESDVAEELENILPKLCDISMKYFPEFSEPIHNYGDKSYNTKQIEYIIKCLKNLNWIINEEDEENWNYMFKTLRCLYSYDSLQSSKRKPINNLTTKSEWNASFYILCSTL